VVHIGPAPPLEAGPGQIVTGTFAHSAANVINLYVEGLDEPIGTTASHPFWCEDRQAFVPAGDLKRGERLRTQDGQLLALTASRPRAADAVFNLEVNTEHVYYVGIHGLLVHNSCDGKGVAPKNVADVIQGHHGIPWNNKTFNHQAHPLVKQAGTNLKKHPTNLRPLKGHIGRHSPSYHQEIRRRMDEGFKRVAGKGKGAAEAEVESVLEGIWKDIGSGKLKPYDHKDVLLLP